MRAYALIVASGEIGPTAADVAGALQERLELGSAAANQDYQGALVMTRSSWVRRQVSRSSTSVLRSPAGTKSQQGFVGNPAANHAANLNAPEISSSVAFSA